MVRRGSGEGFPGEGLVSALLPEAELSDLPAAGVFLIAPVLWEFVNISAESASRIFYLKRVALV